MRGPNEAEPPRGAMADGDASFSYSDTYGAAFLG
jgi:hypothetical protein